MNRNGLRWCDAPREYGSHKTLYNRWKRWGDMGIFMRMMDGLSAAKAKPRTIMIDATYLKADCTASSLRLKKGDLGRLIGRTKGGMNIKLHAGHRSERTTAELFMIAVQAVDNTGASALLNSLPMAQWMLVDR